MATKTWVWTGTTSLFVNDANLTGTMNVNKGTTPSDFNPAQVVSVRFEIDILGQTFSDDTWSTTRDYRIATASTGSIGAAVNGADQGPLQNTTDQADITDNSPNTGLSIAQWNAMEVYGGDLDTEDIWATYFVNMMADGGLLFLQGATAVTITITYNIPELITHATDARIGTFTDHTTDATIFEFDRPRNTTYYGPTAFATKAHKIEVQGGKIWMVGVESGGEPDTIRLWEGEGGPGIGIWVVHDFTHGSGTSMVIRDVALAAIGNRIHIVYAHHNYGGGGAMRLYHIYWDTVAKAFTDNGVFGTGESHPTSSVSLGMNCDLVATADGELVAGSAIYTYLNFGPDNRYRKRLFVYRSVGESFSGVTNYLYDTIWGENTTFKPSGFSQFHPAGDDVYITHWYQSRFDSSAVEHDRYALDRFTNASVWYLTGGAGGYSPIHSTYENGRMYRQTNRQGLEELGGLISAAVGGDDLIFDESRTLLGVEANPKHWYTFIDHYGEAGIYFYTDDDQNGKIYLWNGIDAYNLAEDFPYPHTNEPDSFYISDRIVDRQFVAWDSSPSAPWVWVGVDIGTWFRAHTTDAVIAASGDGQVYHKTDALLVRGPYGDPMRENAEKWVVSSGAKYYTALMRQPVIAIFESTDPLDSGVVITEWFTPSSNSTKLMDWDFIEVSGTLHFIIMQHTGQRFEVHYSTYVISTDTWVHNGSFQNASINDDFLGPGSVAIRERADGDLIALYNFKNNNTYYSINTGAGFPTGTALGLSVVDVSIAVDNNDTHFVLRNGFAVEHWRLSPTDVLGARQTATPMLDFQDVSGIAHPLVANGVMYLATTETSNIYVAEAATGSDAPTWTKTLVTTRDTDRIWFVYGLNGVPTFIYVEDITFKIFKTHLEAGSWVEIDTGYVLDIDDLGFSNAISLDTVDSNNMFNGRWERRLTIDNGNTKADWMYWPLRVNLNPTVFHTTDAVLIVQTSQTINVGTIAETDTLLHIGVDQTIPIGTLAETDSLIPAEVLGGIFDVTTLAEIDTPLAISGTKTAAVGTIPELESLLPISTGRAFSVNTLGEVETLILIGHDVDASTDILLTIDLAEDVTLDQVQAAIGLGIVGRAGRGAEGRTEGSSSDHAEKIYHPDRRIVRK